MMFNLIKYSSQIKVGYSRKYKMLLSFNLSNLLLETHLLLMEGLLEVNLFGEYNDKNLEKGNEKQNYFKFWLECVLD